MVDWLPTLLTAIKSYGLSKKKSKLVDLFLSERRDGMDQWSTLISDMPSNRTEFLYNIDPLFDDDQRKPIGNAGIR